MIYDTLDHVDTYRGISSRLALGLDYLRNTDFSQVEDGEYELDGRDVFVRISRYTTKEENLTPEAHRDYIDIQFLIEGAELIGVAPLSEMTEEVDGRPEGDIWFYHGPEKELLLSGKSFMVFFPQDAHAPCIAPEAPAPARKCLIKVKI